MSEILRLSLTPGALLNVYLLRGRKTILIDTGLPKSGRRILGMMAKAGVTPAEISLILLTHGHIDHAGSALELRQLLGVPVAISTADAPLLQMGKNHLPPPITPMGSILRLVLGENPTFPAVQPDVLLNEGSDLEAYGVSARIIAVPGHTAGMIALLTEENEAIAADGFAGHPLSPRKPSVMYLHDDRALAAESLRKLVAFKPTRYHVGHGGPFAGPDIERWLEQGGGI